MLYYNSSYNLAIEARSFSTPRYHHCVGMLVGEHTRILGSTNLPKIRKKTILQYYLSPVWLKASVTCQPGRTPHYFTSMAPPNLMEFSPIIMSILPVQKWFNNLYNLIWQRMKFSTSFCDPSILAIIPYLKSIIILLQYKTRLTVEITQ